ncbi:MAG: cation:proton antiporter [Candidatus Koribacter versatilis]|uniref:Cation:proton antiporter n=1 Tax=Candidatus Korobacter versatilis TaxID=658062 RepID=A0A932A7C4_9BACT|nr:cation:proton antiporter [Candidatus Koribacter versatilis]
MSEHEIGPLTLVLLLILGTAHLLGWVFTRLRQPRVIGEILAGVVLGPSLLGHFFSGGFAQLFQAGTPLGAKYQVVIGFVYNLGLLLLMFLSGAETRQLFTREERKEVGWLVSVGTGTPFLVALAVAPLLALDALAGPNGNRWAVIIVLAIAVAVTSIPVISRIFADLGILRTRFARLVLGVAVLEDIALWLALAIATALVGKAALDGWSMGAHLATTVAFFFLGLTLIPRLVKRINKSNWNVLAKTSPVAYVVGVLLAYCAVAGALEVSLVFAAFLAGFAVVHKKRRLFAEALESVGKFSFAVFIPIYFAIVGWRLDLSKSFSFRMLLLFLVGSCLLKLVSVALGARLAGFRGLDVLNLAVATNARGGPGIVLASVAYDAGIINAAFYTTLVLAAVLTSQAAGAWLEYVLRKGWPLLKDEKVEAAAQAVEAPIAA